MSISRFFNRWDSASIFSVVFVSLFVQFAGSQGQDPCTRYGQNCVAASNCPDAAELISNRKALQCGYQNREMKICCNQPRNPSPPQWTPTVRPVRLTPVPSPASVNIPPSWTTLSTPSNNRPPKPKPTQPPLNPYTSTYFKNATATVLLKCEEYAKYRFKKRWVDPPLVGQQGYWHEDLDCVHTLISGGTKAEPKEFPHMALIGYGINIKDVQWSCGGSLISDRFILSAAHCGKTSTLGPPRWARLGDLNITSNQDTAKPALYRIIRVYDHPNYKPPSYYNDISLFELNASVAMSPFVRPACLHTPNSGPAVTSGTITGWGAIGHGYRQSDHLLKASVSVMSEERCKNSYNDENDARLPQGFNTTTMVCAGDYTGAKDTCSGDSGGPLQMPMQDKKYVCMWTIFGVTSFGKICGNTEEPDPGVYTKVASYMDWIQTIVWP